MATLVLTTVGTLVGGPIGAAVGAIVGQQIDQAVFKPAARQGPRLSDLAVQTSTYGSRLPKLFGAVRVAGTVIWATDLIETRSRQGGGKGRAATDVYSYSASFAVALSARRVASVRRIWADGKLLRGAAGDLKVGGVFRLHDGAPDQSPDPMIAAAEGSDATPAYRGTAYAVFEGLQLAEYGNRIPSLSFEVSADDAPVGLGAALAELTDGAIEADAGPPLGGIAAMGDSVRSVAEAFAPTLTMVVFGDAADVRLSFAAEAIAAPGLRDLGTGAGDKRAARLTLTIEPLDATPAAVTIGYFDDARDYQPGLQRARREGAGRREIRVDLPATMDASAVRRLAEGVLARTGAERRSATITLPWRALDVRPGMRFVLDAIEWRVRQVTFEAMVLKLELVAIGARPVAPGEAAPGRVLAQADAVHGPTVIAVVDLPPLGDSAATSAQVAVFANGPSPGWRRAALLTSIDGGSSFEVTGTTALPATMGVALGVLADGPTALIDRVASVEVALANDSLTLFDADEAALQAGANLAMVGEEALQFGRAEALGGARWRLSELWRGRRGTEAARGGHAAGEAFVLLDVATAFVLPAGRAVPGVIVMASGIGDAEPYPTESPTRVGRAARPLSPVQLSATRLANGDTVVRWVRRSREGWRWRDELDVPLAEEREAYRVTRTAGDPSTGDVVDEAQWTYPAALRDADRGAGLDRVTITVAQLGVGGASDAASLDISTG